ncbi:MAG: chorismate mutase [Ruminococcus sp.]|jgi:chorismate mutase/prephenate dehydratase|nr:chorismate mutase [Ruminococcus sp.]
MNLDLIRKDIDQVDTQILELFASRMNLSIQVAEYKKANNLPIFQPHREKSIIERVRENSPQGLENATEVLFTTMIDSGKCLQNLSLYGDTPLPPPAKFIPKMQKRISCQGTHGAYSETACRKIFPGSEIIFADLFSDVVNAVNNGECDCGILPLQNSTIGSITETYELMALHNFYINAVIRVETSHCLAAKNNVPIKSVLSKAEALSQCSKFIEHEKLTQTEFPNTAVAAEFVKNSPDETIACICSKSCAERLGLCILNSEISNANPNYTRFICFSKEFSEIADSNIISVSLSVEHSKGALYRLLTKFAVSGLNLTKIENKPIAGSDFNVIFYLDFEGQYNDPRVNALLRDLGSNNTYFKFLGSFKEII